jgi:hypothetical protein
MERFGYTLKTAKRQPAELLQLLEYESWGYKMDQAEQLEEYEQSLAASNG